MPIQSSCQFATNELERDGTKKCTDNDTYSCVFENGRRVKQVFLRSGKYYARIVDCVTGKRRQMPAPSLEVAKQMVKDAKNAKTLDQMKRLHEVYESVRSTKEFASIGDLVEAYPVAAARRRRLNSAARPRESSVRRVVSCAKIVFSGNLNRSCDDIHEVVDNWAATVKGVCAVSVRSYARLALCIVARWAIDDYRRHGLNLPSFIDKPSLGSDGYRYELPAKDLRERTIDWGKAELDRGTKEGLVFMLCYYCAMSAIDAACAKFSNLQEDGRVIYYRHKTGKRACPPLSKRVLDIWRSFGDDPWHNGGFVLPQSTEASRHCYVTCEFSQCMRDLGWETGKCAHELRKLAASNWMSMVGTQWACAWTGDSEDILKRYYADFVMEKAPPAPDM